MKCGGDACNVLQAAAAAGACVWSIFLRIMCFPETSWAAGVRRARPSGYREHDDPKPINFYYRTKRMGELIVMRNPNNLVIRAPFRYGPPWAYGNAFEDQWTSARWLHEVAPDVAEAALSSLAGIIHIGGPRRSLLQMARTVSPNVTPSRREDWQGLPIPQDTSLDSSRWNDWKANKQGSLLAGVSK